MSLVINHNMMAMNAARNLGIIYGRLSKSTERLSSGLRINSAGDDAAGLAIRELMRSDIAVMQQGIRNASDGISMIQTAEGAMAVMDEKLTRMKELAEQAATGTYTTVQREIMNSEYIAMAAEIDRIANATDFAGTKLLDGSLSKVHNGSGLKIHFGTGNSAAEDYYFVRIGDVRATTETGLRVGGDAFNDIWGQGPAGGCCGTGGVESLSSAIFTTDDQAFSYSYNHVADSDVFGAALAGPSYIAGVYHLGSGSSLQALINEVNRGSQSRIQIDFAAVSAGGIQVGGSGLLNLCIGDEVYQFGAGGSASGVSGDMSFFRIDTTGASSAMTAASAFTQAVLNSSDSFWAIQSGNTVYVFNNLAGDYNKVKGCDVGVGSGLSATAQVTWRNMESWESFDEGTTFALGGNVWGRLQAVSDGHRFGVTLNGRQVGDNFDLRIWDVGSGATIDLGSRFTQLTGYGSAAFSELQDAADGPWDGAHIRTQSHAQEALDAIQSAIERKDMVRANLGAYQNRLENTITNLSIMAENLQASESRISDVDVAVEMTEFTKNNVLAQAATAMLAQANTLPQLALSLLG
jgi:flagellin